MPTRSAELRSQAANFANQIQRVLNTTITSGITIGSARMEDDDRYGVGLGLSDRNPFDPKLMPLTISRKDAELYLFAHY